MTKKPKRYKVCAFGEILWDMLPEGKKLGGAPANFAYHCNALEQKVRLVSAVGFDELGTEIIEAFVSQGLKATFIGYDAISPTGIVDVGVSEDGLPSYTIRENSAWDYVELLPGIMPWAGTVDAIYFGSLAMRSEHNRHTLQRLFKLIPLAALRVLDLNLREPFCQPEVLEFVFPLANVLKLNDEELERVVQLLGIKKRTIESRIAALQEKFGYKLVIVTCGAEGSYLSDGNTCCYTPAQKVKIKDTVGAGDAYIASAVINFLAGRPLKEIGEAASRIAAYVCTQSGGTPVIPPDFIQ
ncbi:MAG: carbohydrate kinase [Planctomycetaceae bacterium]|nr:carbohydrate kinase [Planctomycetaceae bacterium]